jgi:hypothetical protein
MTKPLLPWEKKGHTFQIGWPVGFVAQPYIPPHPLSKFGDHANLAKGRDTLNKLTGRKYYGKKATHDYLQGKKSGE